MNTPHPLALSDDEAARLEALGNELADLRREKVRLLLFYRPGRSHLGGIQARAEFNHAQGVLKGLPEIVAEECEPLPGGSRSRDPFWRVVLTVLPEDRAFWLGFASGMDFCRNNRGIAVGVD